MKIQLPYAEDIGCYWKTSKSAPDRWIERAKQQIEEAGGVVLGDGFGSDATSGQSAYMLAFELGGTPYKVTWPVLPTKKPIDGLAARVQAATMLYRDIKARCVTAKVLGARSAFFSYLLLPGGGTATDLAAPELVEHIPGLLRSVPALPPGDVVEGGWEEQLEEL